MMKKDGGKRADAKQSRDIIVAGVGGQGVLLASEVIAEAAALTGLDVKKSEVHGMAQRGGSVVSHLRFGKRVSSPLVSKGDADFLISFEKLETLRYLDYLHPDSWAIVNSQQINPLPVSSGRDGYPRHVEKVLAASGARFKLVDGAALAERAGNRKAVNAVILGVMSKLLHFDEETWREALGRHVPERFLEVNLEAFREGRRRTITSAR